MLPHSLYPFFLILLLLLLLSPPTHQFQSIAFSTRHHHCLSSSQSPPAPPLPPPSPTSFLQVLTDIDDTLKSSGGLKVGEIALGGLDTQYQRGVVYPGVFTFILELSLHASSPLNPAVLTARAEELKLALELKPDSKICLKAGEVGRKRGVEGWGIGPVLYGSVVEWVNQVNKGFRKFKNFESLLSQESLPQISYVYLGDTGEYDSQAGLQMLRYYPEKVKGVFLHVVGESLREREMVRDEDMIVNGRPVMHFITYCGAAVKAYENGLMGRDGVERVIESVYEDLREMGVGEEDGRWRDVEREEGIWRFRVMNN
ncbi:hypothetical protein TL16_g10458 [Triparma laevis f. inornata]|uniref:Phosphatidate phosphatase APP1 catalytic domain-containing protein n=1 Tax=Triparma laevis f. inornata TaxID=1714386 RepID=A0A9W7B8N6_9STRA|nr:hypothetical protein TL16_g10458 [Triparma laevis f. inornata]